MKTLLLEFSKNNDNNSLSVYTIVGDLQPRSRSYGPASVVVQVKIDLIGLAPVVLFTRVHLVIRVTLMSAEGHLSEQGFLEVIRLHNGEDIHNLSKKTNFNNG